MRQYPAKLSPRSKFSVSIIPSRIEGLRQNSLGKPLTAVIMGFNDITISFHSYTNIFNRYIIRVGQAKARLNICVPHMSESILGYMRDCKYDVRVAITGHSFGIKTYTLKTCMNVEMGGHTNTKTYLTFTYMVGDEKVMFYY